MNQQSYTLELHSIIRSLPEANQNNFLSAFQPSEKNPVVLFGFNIWLGWLGIDRFLVGDVLAGVLKLLTFGGFGIWQLVDCFLIGGRARDKNIALARQMAASFQAQPASASAAAAQPSATPDASSADTPSGDNPANNS